MKKCPSCNRTYVDETLNYCLEDGAPLVFDLAGDDASTAIMPGAALTGESPTVTFGSDPGTLAQTAVLPAPKDRGSSNRKFLIAGLVGVVLLALLGLGGYKYYERRQAAQIESIAVMPFVNESGSGEFEYLSDGMTETLINNLSELPNLSVKGRGLVFRYKGKDVDPKQLASELNVRAVLNGRVLQRGDVVTLSLDLVDAVTGNQIWGDQYTRKVTDLVALQAEVARDVSNKLKMKLSGADERNLAKNYSVKPEAFQLYLQGRYQWNKRTPAGASKATEYFQSAIDKDPQFALAYVGLADSYIVADMTPREAHPQAKAAALKALEIDPTLGEAHAVLANVAFYYEWDWPTAEREYKKAIELNPHYPTVHHWYGETLAALGRFDESFAEYQRAIDLDPLSLAIGSDMGMAYFLARKYDRAEEHLKRLIELDPNYVRTHFYLASVYEDQGKFDAATDERGKGILLAGGTIERVAQMKARVADAMKRSGPKGYWRVMLELEKEGAGRRGSEANPINLAAIYSILGEKDEAFAGLEKAVQMRSTQLVFLNVESSWDNLRSDPRFEDLLRRTGRAN